MKHRLKCGYLADNQLIIQISAYRVSEPESLRGEGYQRKSARGEGYRRKSAGESQQKIYVCFADKILLKESLAFKTTK